MKEENMIIRMKREELLAKTPWLNIYYDDVVFPGGKDGKYIRLVETGGNGIVIIPINEMGEIGLLYIYRYPISAFSWELPRGFGEGVSPEENAARELGEETQMTYSSVQHLGTIYSNTGLSANQTDVVCVTGLRHDSSAKPDPNEPIRQIQFVSMGQLGEMMREGIIKDAFTLSAISLAIANNVIKPS